MIFGEMHESEQIRTRVQNILQGGVGPGYLQHLETRTHGGQQGQQSRGPQYLFFPPKNLLLLTKECLNKKDDVAFGRKD